MFRAIVEERAYLILNFCQLYAHLCRDIDATERGITERHGAASCRHYCIEVRGRSPKEHKRRVEGKYNIEHGS